MEIFGKLKSTKCFFTFKVYVPENPVIQNDVTLKKLY